MDVLGSIATIFARAGFEVFLVGGSVRDRLLGRASKDVDLTTNARPADIKRLLRQAKPDGLYDIGERFGTVGAMFGDAKVEITTYRSEWYPDEESRHPEVEFGDRLEDDLARRDFTINAIAQDIGTGKIEDPHNGVADLAKKMLRAVGIPAERFREDPLRMLRAVRLATQLRFEIERKTAAAIKESAGRLQFISGERLRDELTMILVSERPAQGILSMIELGLIRFIMPELAELASTDQDERHQHKDVLAHTLQVLGGVPADPVIRLAALLHDIGKPATMKVKNGKVQFHGHEMVGTRLARKILERLRYDKTTIRAVADLVAWHMRSNLYESDWSDGAVRRYMRDVGERRTQLLTLSRADITSYRARRIEAGLKRVAELEARCDLLAGQADVEKMEGPLDGAELMELFGREPGPWIKPIKDYLLGLVLDGYLDQGDKKAATKLANEFVARQPAAEEAKDKEGAGGSEAAGATD
jgi:poly(A) polymerase